jgi:hypothetical protein
LYLALAVVVLVAQALMLQTLLEELVQANMLLGYLQYHQ